MSSNNCWCHTCCVFTLGFKSTHLGVREICASTATPVNMATVELPVAGSVSSGDESRSGLVWTTSEEDTQRWGRGVDGDGDGETARTKQENYLIRRPRFHRQSLLSEPIGRWRIQSYSCSRDREIQASVLPFGYARCSVWLELQTLSTRCIVLVLFYAVYEF